MLPPLLNSDYKPLLTDRLGAAGIPLLHEKPMFFTCSADPSLAQSASFVTYGNACLRGMVEPDAVDWPRLSTMVDADTMTFDRCRRGSSCYWRCPHTLIATSPDVWLRRLRSSGVRYLQLLLSPSSGRPIMRAFGPPDSVETWRGSMRYVGDRLSGRVWRVTYTGQSRRNLKNFISHEDLHTAASDLRHAVESAREVALRHSMWRWEQGLEHASDILQTTNVTTVLTTFTRHFDIMTHASLEARRLALASELAARGIPRLDGEALAAIAERDHCRAAGERLHAAARIGIAAAANSTSHS
jgi:hypothetical protein